MGVTDLVSVLKKIPELRITQSGPMGQQASVFMQGSGSNHTLMMINGIPINDQSTTQGLHDFGVDFIQTVQQIEIYSGSNAVHFGTNAIGGAINIIMASDFKDSLKFTSNSTDSHNLSLNRNIIFENSSLNIKAGTVRKKTNSAISGNNKDLDAVKNYSSNINYEYWLNERIKLYNTTYIRQTISQYDSSSSNQYGYEGDNRMYSIQSGIENNLPDGNMSLVFYNNKYDRKYDERNITDKYKSDTTGIKFDFSKNISDRFSFGFGSEYKYDFGKFNNHGSYSASTKGNVDNLALYGNTGIKFFDNTFASFFLRNDNHKKTGDNLTSKFNINQNIGNINIGISRMSGLRNPTIYELYGTDNYGYSGNQNLKSEKSKTNEIYLNKNFEKDTNFSLKYFRTAIMDNIEYLNNQYVNDKSGIDLIQSGLNSNLSVLLGESRINTYYSYLSSKKDGSHQLRRPQENYGVSINNEIKNNFFVKLNIILDYNHYGKHYDTHSSTFSTVEMDSSDIVNLNFIKKINKMEINLNVENIFNETYQRPHGYEKEKLNLMIGLKY